MVSLKWHSESFAVPSELIPLRSVYAAPLTCPQCNDGDPNTVDMCTRSGGCAHLSTSASPCNGAVCSAGTCLNGCDDGNPCTVDVCDGLDPSHTPVSAGTSCSDGDVGNGIETCNAAGTCIGGTPPAIDDENPCTEDTCDPVTGPTYSPLAGGCIES